MPEPLTGVCPSECDADCEVGCHEHHAVPWKRHHDPEACPGNRSAGGADFLSVEYADGRTWTRLDRLTDGRVMCQLCFGYFTVDDLNPVEGGVEDVCKPCAVADAEAASRRDEEETRDA